MINVNDAVFMMQDGPKESRRDFLTCCAMLALVAPFTTTTMANPPAAEAEEAGVADWSEWVVGVFNDFIRRFRASCEGVTVADERVDATRKTATMVLVGYRNGRPERKSCYVIDREHYFAF